MTAINKCDDTFDTSKLEALKKRVDEVVLAGEAGNVTKIPEAILAVSTQIDAVTKAMEQDGNAALATGGKKFGAQRPQSPPSPTDLQTRGSKRQCIHEERTALAELEASRVRLSLAGLPRVERAAVYHLFRQTAATTGEPSMATLVQRWKQLEGAYKDPVERAQIVCVEKRQRPNHVPKVISDAIAGRVRAPLIVLLDSVLEKVPECTIHWVEMAYDEAARLLKNEAGLPRKTGTAPPDEPACLAGHPLILARASLLSRANPADFKSVAKLNTERKELRRASGYDEALANGMVTADKLMAPLQQAGVPQFFAVAFGAVGTEKQACDLLIGLGYRYSHEEGWHRDLLAPELPEYKQIAAAINRLASKNHRLVSEGAVARTYSSSDKRALKKPKNPLSSIGVLTVEEYGSYYPVGYRLKNLKNRSQVYLLNSQPTSLAFKAACEFVAELLPPEPSNNKAHRGTSPRPNS